MKKKLLLLVACICIGAGMLTGCLQGSSGDPAEDLTDDPTDPDNPDNPNNPNPNPAASGVYVAGYEMGKAGVPVATYWKDGTAVNLTSGLREAYASGIFVSGSDVHVVGREKNGSGVFYAKYWKNGIETELWTPSAYKWPFGGSYYNSVYTSVVVVGSDVYISGYEVDAAQTRYIAKYWKNGKATAVTDGLSEASSIAVSGSNVCVAGRESGSTWAAMYWKNGQAVMLNGSFSTANSVVLSGNDVYVAGYDNNRAKYWKNGTEVSLSDKYSASFSIVLSGSDIYVAGYERTSSSSASQYAVYWKNGKAISLTDASMYDLANDIKIVDGDVYTAGNDNNVATYWKNGTAVTLSSQQSWAYSIFVVK